MYNVSVVHTPTFQREKSSSCSADKSEHGGPGATSAALCADPLPGVGCYAHVLLHSSSDTVLWCVFTFTSTSYRIGMSRRANFLKAYSHQNENATVSRQKHTNPRSKELYSEDSCTGNVDIKCTFPVISNDC